MDEVLEGCSISEDKWDEFLKEFQNGWGDTSPCLEYGDCENCPYSLANLEE